MLENQGVSYTHVCAKAITVGEICAKAITLLGNSFVGVHFTFRIKYLLRKENIVQFCKVLKLKG